MSGVGELSVVEAERLYLLTTDHSPLTIQRYITLNMTPGFIKPAQKCRASQSASITT